MCVHACVCVQVPAYTSLRVGACIVCIPECTHTVVFSLSLSPSLSRDPRAYLFLLDWLTIELPGSTGAIPSSAQVTEGCSAFYLGCGWNSSPPAFTEPCPPATSPAQRPPVSLKALTPRKQDNKALPNTQAECSSITITLRKRNFILFKGKGSWVPVSWMFLKDNLVKRFRVEFA